MTTTKRNFIANHGWTATELDTSQWLEVEIDLLPEKDQKTFQNRHYAIDLFLNTTQNIETIYKTTGVKKPDLYRFLKKCLATNANGEIIGYQALVPYKRINAQIIPDTIAGVLTIHPQIGEIINAVILGRRAIPDYPKENKISFTIIHKYFLQLCIEFKLDSQGFPFNLKDRGLRSFQRYARKYLEQHFIADAARESNIGKQMAYMSQGMADPRKQPNYPLERVEFDGHKIDAYFTVGYKMPSGEITKKEISRIWILAIIDVVTRCILGYYITFNPEYNADCIWRS